MTNSRLTDPEVLELRYPVLLERFAIRRGSGGKGKWRAGDGTHRVIRFLETHGLRDPVRLPQGAALRRSTAASRGRRARTGCGARRAASSGSKARDQTVLEPGEAIIIKTPTGGGFGPQRERE